MNTHAVDQAVAFIGPWLQYRYDHEEIPGFVVAIAHHGRVVLNQACGYADLERQEALRPDHIFRIASHSKTFTAAALMLLVEEGRLRLDDAVGTHLPWLTGHPDRRWSEVTIRHLLSHGAGVIRDGADADYWQLDRPFPDADGFRREMMATGLVTDANVGHKYSNYGYTLLGLVIEAVSGLPYARFVTEKVLDPLGLSRTWPEYRTGVGPHVTGYSRREGGRRLPIAPVDTRAMAPATGFCATAEDLCRYFTAHMVGSGALLSDASKREMQKVQWHAKVPGEQAHADYGLGLSLDRVGDRRLFGHGGGFPGCITRSWADPADGLVVVALTNCIDGPAGAMVEGIYKILSYFQEHVPADGARGRMADLQGIYVNLWGGTSIVVTGDRLVAADPDRWDPFAAVERLEAVDDVTLRVTDASSFAAEGELVRFRVADGRVASVNYTGSTMLPYPAWRERQSGRPRVGT